MKHKCVCRVHVCVRPFVRGVDNNWIESVTLKYLILFFDGDLSKVTREFV